MSFGLSNAPPTLTMLMNSIFHKETDEYVIIYIDDVLIYLKSLEDHARHLRTVLSKLRMNKVYANVEEIEFVLSKIKFLGHVVNVDGVRLDMDKMKAISEWKPPSIVKGMRGSSERSV